MNEGETDFVGWQFHRGEWNLITPGMMIDAFNIVVRAFSEMLI